MESSCDQRIRARYQIIQAGSSWYAQLLSAENDAVIKPHGGCNQVATRIQTPTARWVFHSFVGIHVLYIPGQGLMMLNLTDEHQHLLQLLGKRYEWFYR